MVRSETVIKIVPGERFTPFSLAEQLGARIILESSSFQKGRERYSVLLVKEAFQLTQDNRGIFLRRPVVLRFPKFTVGRGISWMFVNTSPTNMDPSIRTSLFRPVGWGIFPTSFRVSATLFISPSRRIKLAYPVRPLCLDMFLWYLIITPTS